MIVKVATNGEQPDSYKERFAVHHVTAQGFLVEVLQDNIWNRTHANYIGKHYAEEKRCSFERCGAYR